MKRFLPSGLMIFAGVLGIAAASLHADDDVTKVRKKFDLREAILRKFLKDNHCPDEPYAGLFIQEADANGLDWRLLPTLSLVESGGGRHAPGNNVFGWNNGNHRFASIADAIHQVASSLAGGKSYKGKDLNGKLAAWNRDVNYRAMVVSIMEQISPIQSAELAQ